MMGVGNLTELIEADTSGINAVLLGIAAELRVGAVLTTQVSAHARRAVREADWARRIMHAAAQPQHACRKGMSDALMTVHAKHPFPDTPRGDRSRSPRRCATRTSACRCRRSACTSTTATACAWGRARSRCGRSSGSRTTPRTPSTWAWSWRAPRSPGSSASATCRTSRSTGAARSSARPRTWAAGARRAPTLRKAADTSRSMNDMIFETVVTTVVARRRSRTSRRWACATAASRWC